MLIRIVYLSVIAPTTTAADVHRLVAIARRRNRQLDVTGALLVCSGNFIQALEGRDEAVEPLMTQIAIDGRHRNVVVVDRSTICRRRFQDWDMALVDHVGFAERLDDLAAGRIAIQEVLDEMVSLVERHKFAEREALTFIAAAPGRFLFDNRSTDEQGH